MSKARLPETATAGSADTKRNKHMKKYQDILYLPHHVSKTRKQMPPESRAAQFAPFAALTGYGEAIDETVRTTDTRLITDEDEAALLDQSIRFLLAHLDEKPHVRVVYFVPDARKSGGAYRVKKSNVTAIDLAKRIMTFSDGSTLPLDFVCALDDGLAQRSVD